MFNTPHTPRHASGPATPRHLAAQTQQLFTTGPLVKRLIQHYRPYICPFGPLIEQIPPGATILDVGCGGGMFLGLLASAKRITHGTGFDTSASAIKTARDGVPASTACTIWFSHANPRSPVWL